MIAGTVVVDASVVVEYLVEVTYTDAARRLFAGLAVADRNLELWAPDLMFAEAAFALEKLVRRRAIAADAGERAMTRLARLPVIASGSAALLGTMWTFRQAATMNDACYLAVAERLHAPLLTADARLTRARPAGAPRVVFIGEI